MTGAETCELVLALDAIGQTARAHEQFAAMHHLREEDGSYWTGLVFADGKRWPEERTTWTGGAMILAADALSRPRRPTASSAAQICRAALKANSTASARLAVADAPKSLPRRARDASNTRIEPIAETSRNAPVASARW